MVSVNVKWVGKCNSNSMCNLCHVNCPILLWYNTMIITMYTYDACYFDFSLGDECQCDAAGVGGMGLTCP